MANWNPWHGCHKKSEGCLHCYVYRADARHGRDSSKVVKTSDFDLPIRKKRDSSFFVKEGELVWTCFTSDFLVEDADEWRAEAWEMIRQREDCRFLFITKRIERLDSLLPAWWGEKGPSNLCICITCENQRRAEERVPIYLGTPLHDYRICCEPLLGPVDLSRWLGPWVSEVVAGGESGPEARECRYEWVLSLREQCRRAGVGFWFKQTGANFVKDGRRYRVPRRLQHRQALKAGINLKKPL